MSLGQWFKFFRSYENGLVPSLTKAIAIRMGRKVHLHRTHWL